MKIPPPPKALLEITLWLYVALGAFMVAYIFQTNPAHPHEPHHVARHQ